jgi:hypothetical protein
MSLKCEAFVTGRCWVCMEWPWWCVMSHLSCEINWPCVESIVHCSLVLLTQIDLQWSYVCLSVFICTAERGNYCYTEDRCQTWWFVWFGILWPFSTLTVAERFIAIDVTAKEEAMIYLSEVTNKTFSNFSILPTTAHEIRHYYLPSFLVIKPSRCTNFSNLFLEWNSTCFRQFLYSSSGVFHYTHSSGICPTGLLTACERDQDGTPFWKSSWWWTEELSEKCSFIPRINLRI